MKWFEGALIALLLCLVLAMLALAYSFWHSCPASESGARHRFDEEPRAIAFIDEPPTVLLVVAGIVFIAARSI